MNGGPVQQASQFLLDLANGKYASELTAADEALSAIPAPWALIVKQALDAFVVINRGTAPDAVQPDGRGLSKNPQRYRH